ncbi:unnamed protein product [Orchesella dallaii]|uniref:p53 DNA-binding domain-containing protein n=1 Tax=Orchesella dallaii TaxID=48710 RepID=A0ABP1QMF0_9HEXA
MASGGILKNELSDPPVSQQFFEDSQDLLGGEVDHPIDETSRLGVNSRDAMLNQGYVIEVPPQWPGCASTASNLQSENPNSSNYLSQLLGNGGLTDSDLETFQFGSDPESLSQILSSDLLNVGSLVYTGTGSRGCELIVPERRTSTHHAEGRASNEYRQRQLSTPAPSVNASIALHKILNDDNDYITLDDWKGELNFQVTPVLDPTKKNLYLKEENKLFCKMGIAVPLKFELDFSKIEDPGEFTLRASLVYTDPNDMNKPVLRCSSHLVEEERLRLPENNRLEHILRPSQPHKDTSYKSLPSRRCYLICPLKFPEPGTNFLSRSYVFTCLSSCKGDDGIGRRPIAMMFCLFDKFGNLYGRRVIKVRICSAPQRDYHKEKDERGLPVAGRKRKSGSLSNEIVPQAPKRASLTSVCPNNSPTSPGSVRCVVTASKATNVEEEDCVSSSQETVYSCEESSQKMSLRRLIREIRWTLSLKQSENPILQSFAKNAYNVLKLTQGICDNAREYENSLVNQGSKEKEGKSPDGGFHEGAGLD